MSRFDDFHRKPSHAGLLSLAAATTVLLIAATAAFGALNARLQGPFDAKLTITASDQANTPPGTVVNRTFKYTPLCESGPCEEVRFLRESSTGSFIKTVLTRVAPGIYEGTEVQRNPKCADGSNADSRGGPIHQEIVEKGGGLATKVKGTIKLTTEGCDEGTFQNAKFVATKR